MFSLYFLKSEYTWQLFMIINLIENESSQENIIKVNALTKVTKEKLCFGYVSSGKHFIDRNCVLKSEEKSLWKEFHYCWKEYNGFIYDGERWYHSFKASL